MKKLALVLAVLMMLGLFAGCAEKPAESKPAESTPAESTPAESTPAESDDPYANIDLSEEVNVVMYVSATEPNAMAEVLAAAKNTRKEGGSK